MERTLVILKPDSVQRRLVGRIINRFEEKGLRIVALKITRITPELAEKNYGVHRGKPFYESLVAFMTSGPVVVMALEAPNAVDVVRKLMGATFGMEAEPGTIRGDFGIAKTFNLVHGSDSAESAQKEIGIFFSADEFVENAAPGEGLLYDSE